MNLDLSLLLVATVAGPVVAVQTQKWIERGAASRQRRLDIFKILMATRGAITSAQHVEALNRIDLEFQARQFPEIRDAWRSYLGHLNTWTQGNEAATTMWNMKRPELLAKLLGTMAKVLGYRFDEVDLASGAYVPDAHVRDENEEREVRGKLLRLLSAQSPLAVSVVSTPPTPEQARVNALTAPPRP